MVRLYGFGWTGSGSGVVPPPPPSGWLLDGNTNGVIKYIGTNDNFDFPIYTNGVERLRVLSTGEVGIGMTSPTEKLQVAGNIAPDTNGTRDLGTPALGWLNLYMSSNIHYQSDLLFKSGGVQKLSLDTNGFVLFNNNQGLDVVSTGGSDVLNIGTGNADVINIGWSGANVNIMGNTFYENVTQLQVKDKLFTVNKGGAVASGVSAGFNIEEGGIITGQFSTNATRDGWYFLAPAITSSATLLLSGLTSNQTMTVQDASGTIAYLSDITNNAWIQNGNTNGSEKYIGTNDNFDFPIRTNNAEIARFTTTGSLGIGIVSPTARLHSKGATADNTAYAFKASSSSVDIMTIRNDNQVVINAGNTDATSFSWTNSGFAKGRVLGLGPAINMDTDVSHFLNIVYDVDGENIAEKIRNNSSGVNARSSIRLENDTNVGLIQLYGSNYSIVPRYQNKFVWFDGVGGTLFESMGGWQYYNGTSQLAYLTSGGNLGVGETTPTARIHSRGASDTLADYSFKAYSFSNNTFHVRNDGLVSSLNGYWINNFKFLHYGGTNNNNFFGGYQSGLGVTAAQLNVAIGNSAFKTATTDNYNTAIGGNALLNLNTSAGENTSVGYRSGESATTAFLNAFYGNQSGLNLSTGAANTFFGTYSGRVITDGSYNTHVGYNTSFAAPTGIADTIAFGAMAMATSSNQMVIGDYTHPIATSFFGRGVSTIASQLNSFSLSITGVSGSNITGATPVTDGSAVLSIFYWDGARGTGTGRGGDLIGRVALAGGTGDAQNALVEKFRIDGGTGFVGINQSSPVKQFSVLGESRLESVAGVIQDTTGGTNTSSGAVTTNIQTIPIPADSVVTITSSVNYRKTAGGGLGVIGQGTTIILTSSVQNIGGVLTLDVVQNTYTGITNAIAGVLATLVVSGTNIIVQGTGVVSDNITWDATSVLNINS